MEEMNPLLGEGHPREGRGTKLVGAGELCSHRGMEVDKDKVERSNL